MLARRGIFTGCRRAVLEPPGRSASRPSEIASPPRSGRGNKTARDAMHMIAIDGLWQSMRTTSVGVEFKAAQPIQLYLNGGQGFCVEQMYERIKRVTFDQRRRDDHGCLDAAGDFRLPGHAFQGAAGQLADAEAGADRHQVRNRLHSQRDR